MSRRTPSGGRIFKATSSPETRRPEMVFITRVFTMPQHPGISAFTFSRRHLPHWEGPGETYFTVFCTHRRFRLPPEARTIALDALRFYDGARLELYRAVVMPDHAHALFRVKKRDDGAYWSVRDLLASIKRYSASEIRRALPDAPVPVWQRESYDRMVRCYAEFNELAWYVASNPVRAGLAKTPEEYPWLYCSAERRLKDRV